MRREKTSMSHSVIVKVMLAVGFSIATGAAAANSIIDFGMTQNVLSGVPFDANGELRVGESDDGELNISSGGEATNTDALIGVNNLSQGRVFVNGAGATWTTNGFLSIGLDGQAFVMVEDGASIVVRDGTDLAVLGNSYAQLTLSGTGSARGLFSTPDFMKGVGTGLLVWDGGILQARGNVTEFFKNFSFGDIDIQANGAFFDTNGYTVGMQTAGILVGAGGLTKLGAGTLDIAGNNSWSGDTSVIEGTLKLGSYTQSGGQTLTLGVGGSANYGKLSVSGVATFNNSNLVVDVIGSPALASNSTLTGVITAGTLSATNFVVTDNSALFDFTAYINGNSVDLGVGKSVAGTTVYSSVLNNNLYPALGAAGVLDIQVQGIPTGDMNDVVTALGRLPDERSVARAAAQTLPFNASTDATLAVLDTFNAIFAGRTAPEPFGFSADGAATNRNAWIAPLGSRAVQSDTPGNASGYGAATWGLAAGLEGDIGDTQVGLAYALANTQIDGNSHLSGAGTRAELSSNVIAVYGSHALDDLMLGFQVDAGWIKTDSERGLSFGGLNRTARGSFDSLSLHAGGSLSKAIVLDEVGVFIPTVRADYTRLGSQGYVERDAGALSLAVEANTVEALSFGVDGRFVHDLTSNVQLDAVLGVSYDVINDDGALTASYLGAPGQSFVAAGLEHSPWLAKAGLGLTYGLNGGANVSLRYDASGRNGYLSQSVSFKAVGKF